MVLEEVPNLQDVDVRREHELNVKKQKYSTRLRRLSELIC